MLAIPHRVFRADETDAILASVSGTEPRPQRHAGLVLAWPRDPAECAAAESALAGHTSAHYRAREVLHWDELGEAVADAVVLTYLVRRRADLSFAAFEAHYRERHAPLARIHHPGIARYVQNFVEPRAEDRRRSTRSRSSGSAARTMRARASTATRRARA